MSSGISITVPIELLPEGMSVTDAVAQMAKADEFRRKAGDYKQRYNAMCDQIASAGASLQLILDEVDDEWQRVQALRKFAGEMKEMGAAVRKLP